MNYYNENDEYCAQWLRSLIGAGHIAPGEVDTRSIEDVRAADLQGFIQCHFFAGVGVWSLALRMAGWPDDRPVWTGSCPCQPFSNAGKKRGHEDKRHLWPAWERLIHECRPERIFGEQVASQDGYAWLDLVLSQMEDADYTVGACVTPTAGFGAPHGRHRIWFVADSRQGGCKVVGAPRLHADGQSGDDATRCGTRSSGGSMGHTQEVGRAQRSHAPREADGPRQSQRPRDAHLLDHAPEQGLPLWRNHQDTLRVVGNEGGAAGNPGPVNGFWANAEWVLCRDPQGDRWRPIEPGSFPVADGAAARVGRLRAYGNAIVPQVAAAWIEAFMEVRGELKP